MRTDVFFLYLIVMAGVTYLIRMLPLTVFRREIKSCRWSSAGKK